MKKITKYNLQREIALMKSKDQTLQIQEQNLLLKFRRLEVQLQAVKQKRKKLSQRIQEVESRFS
jgi:septal ring factor EnvC (AmiA/AmiB activator)